MNKIVITGHSYAFPYYFKVFEYLEEKDEFVFILPKLWLAKAGKVRVRLETKPGLCVYGLNAVSYGGRSIRGLLKGWLPGIVYLLPYLRFKKGARILYSCSEPNLLTTLFNAIIARFLGMRFVFFTWQNVPPEQRMRGLKLKLSNTLVGLNLRLANGVICGNKKAADIVRQLGFGGGRLRLLECKLAGIDTEKFRPGIVSDWREKLSINLESKVILFYGALEKRKGLNVLVDAFNLLYAKSSTLNAILIIVGTGPEEKNLKSQVQGLKLQEKVIFFDWMPNDQLPAMLNVADVFVYPSVPSGGWEEQFGYAMAEASACGVPVVATASGSIDEAVINGHSGFLVTPKSPEQLAGAISKIISDPELANKMGEYGRRYAVENFSHQVIARKISQFLKHYAA